MERVIFTSGKPKNNSKGGATKARRRKRQPKNPQVASGEKEAKSKVLEDDPNLPEKDLDDLKKYEDKVDDSTKKKMKKDADSDVDKGKNHNSKAKALMMARIVAEANDKIDAPIPVLMAELAPIKAMKGVTGFGYENGNGQGEFRIVMFGSEYIVDPSYTTKRQRDFDKEVRDRTDIDDEMKEKLLTYNKEVPNGTLEVDEVMEHINNGEVFNPNTKRFGNPDRKKPLRDQYMGPTPGKNTEVGQAVKDRMLKDGTYRIDEMSGKEEVFGPMRVKNPDGSVTIEEGWFDIEDAHMGHIEAAVDFWNRKGIDLGPRHQEITDFMYQADNYELQHGGYNSMMGAKSKSRYKKYEGK